LSSFSDSALPLRYRALAFADKLFERLGWSVERAADCIVSAAHSLVFTKLIIIRLVHEAPNGHSAKALHFLQRIGSDKGAYMGRMAQAIFAEEYRQSRNLF
jgi:hypothetical protein